METIWDHNPTDAELETLFDTLEHAAWHKSLTLDRDSQLMDLVRLMSIRGDDDAAQGFLAQISDPAYRFAVSLTLVETA